jgi:hypothetical protein
MCDISTFQQHWKCVCHFAVEPGTALNIMKARRTVPLLSLAMDTLETAPRQKARVPRDTKKEQRISSD